MKNPLIIAYADVEIMYVTLSGGIFHVFYLDIAHLIRCICSNARYVGETSEMLKMNEHSASLKIQFMIFFSDAIQFNLPQHRCYINTNVL